MTKTLPWEEAENLPPWVDEDSKEVSATDGAGQLKQLTSFLQV